MDSTMSSVNSTVSRLASCTAATTVGQPAAAALAQIASVDAAPQPRNDTWRALTTRNAAKLLPGLLDHT